MANDPLPCPWSLARLTAVRHGESVANAAYARAEAEGTGTVLDCGDSEVPLTPLGVAQATALGGWLAGLDADERPELVVCSPYLRARRTWEIMRDEAARRGADPTPVELVDERLRDRETGIFETHSPTALRRRDPAEARRRDRLGGWFHRPPGGESLADVGVRVRDFLGALDAAAPGRRVLVVAHDAIAVLLRQAVEGLGAPPPTEEGALVPNASVSTWVGDGRRLRLAAFGDTAHLGTAADAG
ncbi:histidine phosphatase family protein [Streptomyces sp. RFCAC02]|uniref:histidine phosphatase family protein n=1 Tax=Streptomyces sp. RFCAC02 TaxID=2499143 RepID=UPI0010210D58|nr:histidine phosphatase family protein [Streptomyces sp. RFCAC02]